MGRHRDFDTDYYRQRTRELHKKYLLPNSKIAKRLGISTAMVGKYLRFKK